MKEADFQKIRQTRPDLVNYFEFVKAGGHISKGYYRRRFVKPSDPRKLSRAERERRVVFAEAAMKTFGQKGFRNGVPVTADSVRSAVKGKSFQLPPWKRAIAELRVALGEIAEVVATET